METEQEKSKRSWDSKKNVFYLALFSRCSPPRKKRNSLSLSIYHSKGHRQSRRNRRCHLRRNRHCQYRRKRHFRRNHNCYYHCNRLRHCRRNCHRICRRDRHRRYRLVQLMNFNTFQHSVFVIWNSSHKHKKL